MSDHRERPAAKGFFGRIAEEVRHWTRSDWSLTDVEKHYDSLAHDYDEVNRATTSHFRRFTDALELAPVADRARVLEIFSRTGEGTAFFHQQGKLGSAVCVDLSDEMGKICKRRLSDAGLDDVRWIKMVDYSLPVNDSEFDVVFCLETIEHVPRPGRLIRELARVTKRDGLLVLSTPNVLWEPVHALAAVAGLHHSEGPHRFIRYRRLTDMVGEAGFQIEHAETNVLVPAGPRCLVRLGGWLEDHLPGSVMTWIGLRRMLICRKRRP